MLFPSPSRLLKLELTLSSYHSMTNTRITDPEVLERRYPVLLHEFSIRDGSGGEGLYHGGDGVVRDIEFLEPIQASILSEVSRALTSFEEKEDRVDGKLTSSFPSSLLVPSSFVHTPMLPRLPTPNSTLD